MIFRGSYIIYANDTQFITTYYGYWGPVNSQYYWYLLLNIIHKYIFLCIKEGLSPYDMGIISLHFNQPRQVYFILYQVG